MRVAIVNQHTNNYGDEAAGVALVSTVLARLDPDVVDIVYIWHKYGAGLSVTDPRCSHHYPDSLSGLRDRRPMLVAQVARSFVLRRQPGGELGDMIRLCSAADVVLVAPAGSNLGIYKDWMYSLFLLLLQLGGVKLSFCQNSVGASDSRLFDAVSRYILRRSQVFVRELASHRWLARHRISSYLGVDTALLLEPRSVTRTATRKYIAVVPTALSLWHRDFRKFDDSQVTDNILVGAVARIAVKRDLEVVLVPHLNDREAETSLLEGLSLEFQKRGCRAEVAGVGSLEGYRCALASAEAVVSMRYHGLVISAAELVPCVSLSYENKMVEAARYLGLGDLEVPVAGVSEPVLSELVERALVERARFRATLAERLPALRQIALGPLLSLQSRRLREEPTLKRGR